MTLRTGVVNTSTADGLTSYLGASLATQQAANIAANDHVKFDTVNFNDGVSVVLDTTTAYSNTAGAASVGRATVKGTPNGGLSYKLSFDAGYCLFSGATGVVEFQFYDATAGALIAGGTASVYAATDAGHDGSSAHMEAYYTPLADTNLVEVRIVAVTALTRIGTTASRYPTLSIQTL